uniref:Uncharacterized protein n=1 Tax=Helianthus annuus TaxID=4232 RepID=A0A251SUF1_HELAN
MWMVCRGKDGSHGLIKSHVVYNWYCDNLNLQVTTTKRPREAYVCGRRSLCRSVIEKGLHITYCSLAFFQQKDLTRS